MEAQPVGLIEKGVAEHLDEGKFPIHDEMLREFDPFMKSTHRKVSFKLYSKHRLKADHPGRSYPSPPSYPCLHVLFTRQVESRKRKNPRNDH